MSFLSISLVVNFYLRELEAIFGAIGGAGSYMAEQIDVINSASKKACMGFSESAEEDAVAQATAFCNDVKVDFSKFTCLNCLNFLFAGVCRPAGAAVKRCGAAGRAGL